MWKHFGNLLEMVPILFENPLYHYYYYYYYYYYLLFILPIPS